MPLQLCQAGKHYYDHTLGQCPYCEADARARTVAAPRTTRLNENPVPRPAASAPKTTTVRTAVAAPKTELLGAAAGVMLPVTGWLVLLTGKERGRDFRLIQGENRIGRNRDMEVCLDFGANSDPHVSRDTHAAVVYDHHAREFFVERGHSRNLPLLNGATVRGEPVLQPYDVLRVGQTDLLFLPLCGKTFAWQD